MNQIASSASLLIYAFVTCAALAADPAVEDVADIPALDLRAEGDERRRYFLIGLPESKEAPKEGHGIVVVLPGGPGSADFHPFVKRIYKHALPKGYLVAQPVAIKWTEQQQVVWPTEKNSVAGMGFSTEEFVTAVIRDVQSRTKLDAKHVFTLSWSSSGPAAYSISLTNPQVTGSFVAMSVFNPNLLPSLEKAKGHRYFLYHSQDDRVCPFSMAEKAANDLERSGAKVKLTRYQGGHGWKSGLYTDIREGIEWLEAKPSQNDTTAAASENILSNSGIEDGDDSPAHWSRGAAIEGVEYDWDKGNGQKGNASLCLNKTADRYFPIAQWSQTVQRKGNDSSVQVSAQVKAERLTKAVIDVIFLDDKAKRFSHNWAAYIGAKQANDAPTTHDWKEYSARVAIPPGTSQIQISLQIYGPGKVWFDEVRAAYAD